MALIFNSIKFLTNEHYELLLEADPSKELIDSYLKRSATFEVLQGTDLIGIVVLLKTRPESLEIVNISVHKEYQNKGVGQKILQFSIQYAKKNAIVSLQIGTGSTSFSQLYLYQKMGFRMTHIDHNFFIHHYKEEISEHGLVLKDMVRLQLMLNK